MKARSMPRRILAMALAIVMTLSIMVFPVSAEDLGLVKGDDVNAKLSDLLTPGESHEWQYLVTYTYGVSWVSSNKTETTYLWPSVNGEKFEKVVTHSETIGIKWREQKEDVTCPSLLDNSMLGKPLTVRVVGTTKEYTITIADGRVDTVLAVKNSVTVKYNSSKSADDYYKEIFDAAIIKSKSTLPADFSFSSCTVSGLPSGGFLDRIEKDTTHTVTISFAGDDYYKAATATVSVFIADPRIASNIVAEDSIELDYRPSKDKDDYKQEILDKAIIKADSTLPESYDIDDFKFDGVPGLGKNFEADKSYEISFYFKGDDDNYKQSNTVKVNVSVVDTRIVPEITANDSVTITYNMDRDVMLQEILDKAIASSNLPEGYTIDDFKITAPDSLDANVDEGDEPYTVTFYYKGNDEYKQSETYTVNVTVQKADVNVTIKGNIEQVTSLAVIKSGDSLPEDFITLDPNDSDIDVWTIFAGKTNEGVTIVYVDLPARYTNKILIGLLDFIFPYIREDGKTFTELVSDGMTVAEFKELMNDLVKAYEWAEAHKDDTDTFLGVTYPTEDAKKAKLLLKIMPDTVVTIAEQITKLPDVFDTTTVALGTPKHAGVYATLVVTESDNYNAAYAFGGVVVAPKYDGNTLVWNTEFPESNTFTVSELNAFDLTAKLCDADGETIEGASISYKYTGSYKIFWFIKIDYSSEKLPTRAGSYTQVATCYTGDNISILPLTRSFTLTKD